MKKVLTIAGSDSSGGAGIQADIKTMSALGVYAMSVITAVTAQNSMGVTAVQELDVDIVQAQLCAVFDDIAVDAVKIGMVSNPELIACIRAYLLRYDAHNVVLDPVMVSKSGYHLLKPEAMQVLKGLLPLAKVVTPNIPEAEALTGMDIHTQQDMEQAALAIAQMGAQAVLVKGGHRCNDANDILYDGEKMLTIPGTRIDTPNTHGTGCTLSSAIASFVAKGYGVRPAVEAAKAYITQAIEHSFAVGHGVGPVGHLISLYQRGGVDYES